MQICTMLLSVLYTLTMSGRQSAATEKALRALARSRQSIPQVARLHGLAVSTLYRAIRRQVSYSQRPQPGADTSSPR